jgi:PIN domain nuclease of toxin-antitoxin system
MRILLDTHLVLWAVTADPQLGAAAKKKLLDPDNQIYVSAATIWEVAIKHRKHPQVMPIGPDVLADACVDSGFSWLDINPQHARAVAKLPLLHADPFDRMLVAQAMQEPMALLTRDRQIAAYSELVQLV